MLRRFSHSSSSSLFHCLLFCLSLSSSVFLALGPSSHSSPSFPHTCILPCLSFLPFPPLLPVSFYLSPTSHLVLSLRLSLISPALSLSLPFSPSVNSSLVFSFSPSVFLALSLSRCPRTPPPAPAFPSVFVGQSAARQYTRVGLFFRLPSWLGEREPTIFFDY